MIVRPMEYVRKSMKAKDSIAAPGIGSRVGLAKYGSAIELIEFCFELHKGILSVRVSTFIATRWSRCRVLERA